MIRIATDLNGFILISAANLWVHRKKLFIEFTTFFKVSGCNQFILATFK